MLNPKMRLLSIFVLALLVRINLVSALICGNKRYDNSTQTCCNGTVTSKLNSVNSSSIECCKDQTYDTRRSLCCNGVLHTNKSSDTHNCIGVDVYRLKPENIDLLTNSHLDRSTVSEDNKATSFLICGVAKKEKYDPKKNMCCNETLYPFSVDILCCDNTVYNKTTQFCCGGQLRPRSVLNESVECCGTSPFNSKHSLCCNDRLYEYKNPENLSCCGSKPYTLYKDMCCKSEVYKWSNKSLCCENRTYDRDLQYCFNDREILNINESKCDGVKYDTRKSVCCGGTTLHPHNVSQRCCGFEIFDRRTNDCVYDHIVTKHNSWCDPVGEYNTTTHACCKGRRKEINGTSWRCCGAEMIDYDKENCCAGKSFNKRNQQCCSGQIIQMEEMCCSGQRLNQSTQVCCGKTHLRKEKIVLKSAPYHDKCCPTQEGGVSYDSVNFACTYDYKVVNKSLLIPKCKGQIYDPKKDLCCNSKLFKNALKDGMSCCLPSASIYNPQTHVCCFGVRKKGKSCRKPRYRLRCPRRCKLKKMNLKRYCKTFLSNTGRFKIKRNTRRQLRSKKRSNSCRCVYARRQKRPCKGKQCVSFKRLIGISVEKINTTTLYIQRKREKYVKRICPQALSTKENRTL